MHEGRRSGEFLYNIWLPEQQVALEFVSPNELRFKEWGDIEAHYLKLRQREDELARRHQQEAELQRRTAEQLYRRNLVQRNNGRRQQFVRSGSKPARARSGRGRAHAPPTSGGWGKFLTEFANALSLENSNDEVDIIKAPREIVESVFAGQPNLDEKEELDYKISDYEPRNTMGPNVKGKSNRDGNVAGPQIEAIRARERGRGQDRVIHIPANVVFDIERLRDVSQDGNYNFNFILNSKN